MKKMSQFFKFIEPYYRVAFQVVVSDSKRKAFARMFPDDIGQEQLASITERSSGAACFARDDYKYIGLWFSPSDLLPWRIAHEVLHATHAGLRMSGVGPLNDDTEEAYAYYFEYLLREIHRRLKI